jgi:glyoxylate/hydroxypyruvate reductase A
MKIAFCCTNTKAEPWLEAFRQALPGVDIWEWQAATPGQTRKLADHAVVWSPPQSFIDEQTQLQNLFNIGAGVDALLKLNLPASLNIVRLNDAGMSVQMAEYVCHAVIRYFREFNHYDKDQVEQRWSYRKPAWRAEFPVGVLGAGVLGSKVAQALQQFEFPVNVWSRSPKQLPGLTSYTGLEQLPAFLKASKVLPYQCGARQALGRSRLDQFARPRPHGWRHTRCVSGGALACRARILEAPQNCGHAAHLRSYLARRKRGANCQQNQSGLCRPVH